MVRLSVNVNKVATLRNSRGGAVPSVLDAVRVCVDAGVPGITVHPRADARHITSTDVHRGGRAAASARWPCRVQHRRRPASGSARARARGETDAVHAGSGAPGEITSQAGWSPDTPREQMAGVVKSLRDEGIRVSLFVDPEEDPIRWAAEMEADRVELYTEPFARAFERGQKAAAGLVRGLCPRGRAGPFARPRRQRRPRPRSRQPALFRRLPHLDEVSIGHALISHALFVGLERSVREYLDVLAG